MNAQSSLRASSLAIPTARRHVALWAFTSMASNASRLSARSGSHRFHPSSAVYPSLCPCPVSHRLGKPNSGWGAPPACFRHLSEPPLTFFKLLQPLSPWGSPLCPVSPPLHITSAGPPCCRSLPTSHPACLVTALVVHTVLEQAEGQVALGAASGGHPHLVGSGEMLGSDILLIWDPVSAATTA